jgi:hypothetical protein
MSKDFRRDKRDWDNEDWVPEGAKHYGDAGKQRDDINRRKRASKKMSRARSNKDDFH